MGKKNGYARSKENSCNQRQDDRGQQIIQEILRLDMKLPVTPVYLPVAVKIKYQRHKPDTGHGN